MIINYIKYLLLIFMEVEETASPALLIALHV